MRYPGLHTSQQEIHRRLDIDLAVVDVVVLCGSHSLRNLWEKIQINVVKTIDNYIYM